MEEFSEAISFCFSFVSARGNLLHILSCMTFLESRWRVWIGHYWVECVYPMVTRYLVFYDAPCKSQIVCHSAPYTMFIMGFIDIKISQAVAFYTLFPLKISCLGKVWISCVYARLHLSSIELLCHKLFQETKNSLEFIFLTRKLVWSAPKTVQGALTEIS